MDQQQQLLEELTALRSAILEREGSDHSDASEQLTAILTICKGMDQQKWEELVTSHDLGFFLALPLTGDLYPNLLTLQASLQELSRKTQTDPLTGLPNRRAFEQYMDMELERSRRNTAPLNLAVLDLDNFKSINDERGHACGDKVLQKFAGILKDQKRRYDLCARIGGEEFVIVLPGVGMVRAQTMLERVQKKIRALSLTCGDEQFHITCSMGLACTKGRTAITQADLFELADKALYDAKSQGKDRIVTAPIPDLAPPPAEESLVHADEKKFLFTGIE